MKTLHQIVRDGIKTFSRTRSGGYVCVLELGMENKDRLTDFVEGDENAPNTFLKAIYDAHQESTLRWIERGDLYIAFPVNASLAKGYMVADHFRQEEDVFSGIGFEHEHEDDHREGNEDENFGF
jgi:hypothetical protein